MRADFESQYHRVETEHWWFVGRRDLLVRLIRDAGAARSSRILDIGCAGGATIRRLQREGYTNVTGIDLSAEAVARCREQGLEAVHQMDAQAPGFPAASFDLILASDVLEHVADERRAARAWLELLKPHGCLIALVPAFMVLWSAHDEANHHRKRYRLAELRHCLEECGFETLRASYWNFLLFLPAALLRLLQRMRPGRKTQSAELDLPPGLLNSVLAGTLRGENRLLCAGLSLPWGLSALVVARRPAMPAEAITDNA
jgi:2-polyprenyl-3-methyl-5-hydroxy-6-metoxy-1,4-benzoquinol methylase